MAYDATIPKATDVIAQSQIDLQNNFGALKTLIDINHVDFSNTADQGKHYKVTFPVQGGAPVFLAGELGVYNLAYAPTGSNELFITNASGSSYPITASSTTGAPVASFGWTWLPSGMKIVWGQSTIVAGGTLIVNYSSAPGFPGFTSSAALPMITRQASGTASNFVSVTSHAPQNLTQFVAFSSGGQNNVQFAWMTIGR
jgi:hypothetical protein